MKDVFDREVTKENFHVGDLVLKWDARIEDKGKHGKFDHLWKGPYQIASYSRNNAYIIIGAEWIFSSWRTNQWQVAQNIFSVKEVQTWYNFVNMYFYRNITKIPSDLDPAVKALRSPGITPLAYQQLYIFLKKNKKMNV
jgi:hypothetical protein